jgi:L-iditol 2-dehydrogenase
MKANVLYGINDLRYTKAETPQLKQGEVLVRVRAAGICGSDVARVFTNGTYHFPTIIGHEFAGEVVQVYADEDMSLTGKRAAVYPLIPCKQCDCCQQKKYELCRDYNYLGSRCDGGFAEFVAVPKWNLALLPSNVSFEDAAMIEPAAVAFHALRTSEVNNNETIAIIGPGTIGMLLAMLAKIVGVGRVLLIGRNQQKLNFAQNAGIEHVCNSTTTDVLEWVKKQNNNQNVDVVIEGTGAEQSLITALNIAKPSGRVILMGNPINDFHLSKIDYWKVMRNQLVLKGIWNSTYGFEDSDWNMILALLNTEKLRPSQLITHRLPMSELLKGLHLMQHNQTYTNKVMLIN